MDQNTNPNVVSTPVEDVNSPVEAVKNEQDLKDALDVTNDKSGAETSEKSAEEDKFSSKFAALSRKEKEIRLKEQEVSEKLAEYNAWKAEQEEKANKKEPEIPLEYKLRTNPLETLSELGLDLEKLSEIAVNNGQLPQDMQFKLMVEEATKSLQDEIGSLKSEIEGYKEEQLKKEEEALKTQEQQVIENFQIELTEYINSNEDKYELIKATDSVDMVFEVIQDHWNEHKEVLSNDVAAQKVEDLLEEEFNSKFASNPKILERYGLSKASTQQERKEFTSTPTLSNSQTSLVSTKGDKPLSDEESKAAAAALLRFRD